MSCRLGIPCIHSGYNVAVSVPDALHREIYNCDQYITEIDVARDILLTTLSTSYYSRSSAVDAMIL